jgi:UDP-N-acetylmuramoyl-tripeptide--D-alanyl-D-alanine ligase
MRAALETAAVLPVDARRIAILGDMRELGESSPRYHREIGQFVASLKAFDALICVGPDAALIADAAVAAGFSSDYVARFEDAAQASSRVPAMLRDGDLVLLKASRSVHLEEVARSITHRQTTPMRMVAS